jgi:DNA-binding phage protein
MKTATITRDSRLTVVERAKRDPALATLLLDEAATHFLNGDPGIARLVLRDLVHATIGFEQLAVATGIPPKSLHRMLTVRGNPTMDNLCSIIDVLRKRLGVTLAARGVKAA